MRSSLRASCESMSSKTRSPMIEVISINKGSAVGDVSRVVVDDGSMSPVKSPVMPSPTKASKKSRTETHSEGNPWTRDVQPGIPEPTRPYDHRRAIHNPRIVCWHINNARAEARNEDCLASFLYRLLRTAFELARCVGRLTHRLDSSHDTLSPAHLGVRET